MKQQRENPPKYRQIAEQLKTGMVDGKYPIGASLPTVAETAAQYGVAAVTAKAAHELLKQEGLISTAPGRRSQVIRLPGDQDPEPEMTPMALVDYVATAEGYNVALAS